MITRLTGKNQVTVPVEVVRKAGLKLGSRLEWRTTERTGILEIRILPDVAALSAGLRGRGKATGKNRGSAVGRLIREREEEESRVLP